MDKGFGGCYSYRTAGMIENLTEKLASPLLVSSAILSLFVFLTPVQGVNQY